MKFESRPADNYMRTKVLERIGSTTGRVEFVMEEWDFGYCDTCSWPETGLAVKVNGHVVYPNDEVLAAFGGCVYGDDGVEVSGGRITERSQYAHFFDWLDGKDLDKIREEEYDEAEED